jgi:hypothetical protein
MKWLSLLLVCAIWPAALAPVSSYAKNKKEQRQEAKERKEERSSRRKRLKRGKDACDAVKDNCVYAGFQKQGPRGKDLKKDCYERLFLGLTVPKVHLAPEIIASCKALKERAAGEEEN